MSAVSHTKIVATLLALVALVVASPEMARAASEVGTYLPARVWCNASTNVITVKAQFGAGDAYMKGQYLSYRFYALNDQTGSTFWLSSNGDYRGFLHVRQGDPWYDPVVGWYSGMDTPLAQIPEESFVISGASVAGLNGVFHVYAQYRWWSATSLRWLGPITQTTALYENGGFTWAPMTYCKL
jgi:hypothetical protein